MSEKKGLQITLSASKIKTADSCSFKYYGSYVLRLPDKKNEGSSKGTVCHLILECLAEPRRRKLAEKIIKQGDIFKGKDCQGIKRLAYKHAHHLDVADDDNIAMIKEFILNGLSHDFWGEKRGKPVQSLTEKDFDILKEGRYKIRGFIDRLFIYGDGHALIRDYKSSKECFKGDSATTLNEQATMYCLAVRELFPEVKTVSVEFLFLKFDCDTESEWATGQYQGRETKKLYHNGGGLITLNYDWGEVEGFEDYLEGFQEYLEDFTEEDATKNFAAVKPEPVDSSFGGKLNCGFARTPGQLKKDGTLMWSCSYRHPFLYYHVTQGEKFIATCFLDEREKLIHKYPIEEFTWTEKSYSGCPFWYKQ